MKKIIFGIYILLVTVSSAVSFTVYPTRFELNSKEKRWEYMKRK